MDKQTATFSGGCFWCTESDFKKVTGVIDAISGYCGEKEGCPTYENHKGYREATQVVYDATVVTYRQLCQFFLDHIDPTDPHGQFHDRGESYTTALYYKDEKEKKIIESLLSELDCSGMYSDSVVVTVLPQQIFYPAEEYHQSYAKNNPVQYAEYRDASGREDFVQKVCNIREQKKIKWKS
ncbi:MAG: peptide-methionine (S)-S-oxide reductase MsrA [Candidatus Pacebacteria bacterium]|nr:peptide-methionine (S)-S-oxide reductase MsrA [Candidatus Paceibacterota bacterium]